ncbi:MAG: single-stranded-DNA-specific exonuclease RecJ [Candidatus Cloacimonadota bacterium]|nr:single-stranded-DNA-specific exonuclease RecJ [Candidatus Cloacimonadota bacterium]
MKKNWIITTEQTNVNQIQNLQNSLSCPYIIAKLLLQKNINSTQGAEEFFHPDFNNLHDPYIFNDMEKAVRRIMQAIENQEKIVIYGDYDVDGTTATSLLLIGLRELGAVVDFYIPNRMIEGYGLSMLGNKAILSKNANVVITVDCGINAVDEISYLKKEGVDVIVTDHHTPKKILPDAFAIIDPKLKDSKYPYQELAGVGIALKLIIAIYRKYNRDNIENVSTFFDLAGLGTIADIVPLTGENRIIASLGIERLEERKNLGLNYLLNLAGLKTCKLKSSDVVFRLAPRINAAGRLGSADRAVDLMTTSILEDAKNLALVIHNENQKRQQIDQTTFREACDMIESKYQDLDKTFFFVLATDHWHPGVIGIVASKIVEKYNRPTILITFAEGEGSGSGRSIHNFNIFECLSHFEEYLVSFGGHKYAAGLSILPEYIDIFEKKVNEYARDRLTIEDIRPQIYISNELTLNEIDEDLLEWLKRFAPFGPGNMNPIFLSRKAMIVGYPYTVGTNHLKLKTIQNDKTLDLIGFNMGELSPFLKKGSYVDIAYSLEENVWKNVTKIQGKLKDIRPYASE